MEQEIIDRYKERIKKLWKDPNPYYVKGQFPTEKQDIILKIKQLENEIR